MKAQDAESLVKSIFSEIESEVHREIVLDHSGLDLSVAGRSKEERAKIQSGFWIEEPIPFVDFVTHPDHMRQPALSPRQQEDIENFIGTDPKRLFIDPETQYRMAVLLWGKGGGKDWIVSMLEAFVVYVLLCMREPRLALNMAFGENIDIINVAYNASQASDVFFAKFESRLLNWKWLWKRYLIVKSGRIQNREDHPNVKSDSRNDVVTIGDGEVEFPHLITHYSAHSQHESYEGKSLVFWVMDEASAFADRGKKANGWAVYNTLKSSANSRFNNWRGLVISFPRSENDFTMQLYELAQDDETIYTSRAATWDVNPTKTKEHFANDYKKDKEDAECKYECKPPGSQFSYMDRESLKAALIEDMPSRVITAPAVIPHTVIHPMTGQKVTRHYVAKTLDSMLVRDLHDKAIPRVAHIDGGLDGDSAACIIAHGMPVQMVEKTDQGDRAYIMNRVVVDGILRWEPDREQGLKVSLNNVASIVAGVAGKIPMRIISYDHWNSASGIEALESTGIFCDVHNIDTDDWALLKQLLNLNMVEIPTDDNCEWQQLWKELRQLEAHAKGQKLKIDHPTDGSKDVADCLAGVTRLLNNIAVRDKATQRRAPGIRTLSRPATQGTSPFDHSRDTRSGQPTSSLVGDSIRYTQPLGDFHRAASGEPQVELPRGNQGKVVRPPKVRRL